MGMPVDDGASSAGAPLMGLEQGLLIHQFDKQNGGLNKNNPDELWW